MRANHRIYSYTDSFRRLDGILGQSELDYEETDALAID